MINLHLLESYDNTQVFDTDSAYHICKLLQVLARPKRLTRDEMDLKRGNEAKVAIVAIGDVFLHLLGGAIIILDTCYFIFYIIKNIIFILCLTINGYKLVLKNNDCSILLVDKIITKGILYIGLFMQTLSYIS